MSDKLKWPLATALAVAEEIRAMLYSHCERSIIAGSIRRKKAEVGDIEIVYIPRMELGGADLFAPTSAVDSLLETLQFNGYISRRLNVNGAPAWGPSNKLARHTASGIPVDFFAIAEENWWNYVVCRTGGALSNVRIAAEAKARGWKWNPTQTGFTRRSGPDRGRVVAVHSEREVFEFVKLPYLEPEERR